MGLFPHSLLLAIVAVNFMDGHFTIPIDNKSAVWNAFLQYAQLPSIGQETELNKYNTEWPSARRIIARPPITTGFYSKTRNPPSPSGWYPITSYTSSPTGSYSTSDTSSPTGSYPTTKYPTTPTGSYITTSYTTSPTGSYPTTPTGSYPTTPNGSYPSTNYTTTRTTTFSPVTLPPHEDTAKMARFIVHFSTWGSLAYKAAQTEIAGYPSARTYSISDGYLYAGTGVPYFMVSPLDLTIQALKSNDKCSLILSLSQTSYCSDQNWDPQDPRCAQVILTGRFIWLPNDSDEMMIARSVLWDRHPKMMDWYINQPNHKWQFAKLELEFITVIDYFGGRKYPSLSEYFSAEAPEPYAELV